MFHRKGQTLSIKHNGRTIAVELTEDQTSQMYVFGIRLNGRTGRPVGKGGAKVYLIDGKREVISK